MKADDYIEPIVLTPKNIPDFARETGSDESELMNQYYKASAQNKILYGFKGFWSSQSSATYPKESQG